MCYYNYCLPTAVAMHGNGNVMYECEFWGVGGFLLSL